MKVKQINEQEVKSLLKDCPKQVQDYVKALKNLIEIKDHTNKKALDKIKQLSIPLVVVPKGTLCGYANCDKPTVDIDQKWCEYHDRQIKY